MGLNVHARIWIMVDFCKYSYIPEDVFSQNETVKYWLNLWELLVVIILNTDWFVIFLSTSFEIAGGKPIRSQKALTVVCYMRLLLQRWQNIFFLTYFLFTYVRNKSMSTLERLVKLLEKHAWWSPFMVKLSALVILSLVFSWNVSKF